MVRIGYLLQNFKKAIVQNRDPNDPVVKDRPCRAEVRWYGATDTGLRDVRDNVRLWGMKCQRDRHAELSSDPAHKGKSPTEISEMVLSEQWHVKKRKQLYREVHHKEYDGGDL